MLLSLRYFFALAIVLLFITTTQVKAQNWIVGVPVNTMVGPDLIDAGANALGCFPNPSTTYNFSVATVSGVQHYLKVASVDANSCYLTTMNGNDTLQVGDSIPVNGGLNTMQLFYYGSNVVNPINCDLYAAGTPTTVGEQHHCNITMIFGFSNLMLCPEGLSLNLPTNCSVISGPTSTFNTSNLEYQFDSPSVLNSFQATIKGVDVNSTIILVNASGQILREMKAPSSDAIIPCDNLRNGIYYIFSFSKGIKHTEKLSIIK